MQSMDSIPLKILVVQAPRPGASPWQHVLGDAGYEVTALSETKPAVQALASEHFDILLMDFGLSTASTLDLVRTCAANSPHTASIVVAGAEHQELAMQALRLGASDYISAPFQSDELLCALRKLEERGQFKEKVPARRANAEKKYSFSNIIAQSDAMKQIFETVKRLASYSTTVLITGESGTGKELIARALHYNSPRRGGAFVAINCGAIPESLMESELFGHKRGAFTDATKDKRGLLEEASGGTVFLDEIGEMPLQLQVKLLRVLQEQQIRKVGDEQAVDIDIRVIAATHRDLEVDVYTNRFREDLYYRLNVVSIHIPPLRDRPEDIPLLARYFVKKHAKRLNLPAKDLSEQVSAALMRHSWRGNVRELENCIERALVLSEQEQLEVEALPPSLREELPEDSSEKLVCDEGNLSIKQRTRELEVHLIRRALEQTKGNRTHASKILEISHRALLYKLKEYGLSGTSEVDETPT